jgi:hypothetical protein
MQTRTTPSGGRISCSSTRRSKVIAQIMRDGVATHTDNEWTRRSVEFHLKRAEDHLRLLREGEQLEGSSRPRRNPPAYGVDGQRNWLNDIARTAGDSKLAAA